MRPYYDHGGIQIYHGDCREILPTVQADVMVTDPPYGMALRSNRNGAHGSCDVVGDEETAKRPMFPSPSWHTSGGSAR